MKQNPDRTALEPVSGHEDQTQIEQPHNKTSYQVGGRSGGLKSLSSCGQWCIQGDDAPSSLIADRGG